MLINLAKQIFKSGLRLSESFSLRLKQTWIPSVPGGKLLIDAILWPSDFVKNVRIYRSIFQRNPRLFRPRTFNEKLLQSKIFRRKARYTKFSDKLAVRDYVGKRVGSEYLTKIYWTGTDIREARNDSLPSRFVIKANHSWNTVLLVTDRNQFDWEAAHKKTQKWLGEDHSRLAAEWQYRWIQPCLFIEEFLEGENGAPPSDYKFFCFHGRVEFLQVDIDRFNQHTRSMFDRDFNLLPFVYRYPRYHGTIEPPHRFNQMIRVAEELAQVEPFVRVDLYDIGRPIFGELTLHPEGGRGRFDPPEFDEKLGSLL